MARTTYLLDHRLGGGREEALLAARMRFRRDGPRAPVALQEFFDTGHTAPAQVGESPLGAEPPFVGLHNLVA